MKLVICEFVDCYLISTHNPAALPQEPPTETKRMAEKKFASQADLEAKKISWERLSDNA